MIKFKIVDKKESLFCFYKVGLTITIYYWLIYSKIKQTSLSLNNFIHSFIAFVYLFVVVTYKIENYISFF